MVKTKKEVGSVKWQLLHYLTQLIFLKKILMPHGVKELPGQKRTRNRIIMVRCARPKLVTLPNGRRFTARFKRATHDHLTANVNFPGVYKQRATPKGKCRRRTSQQRG